MIKLIKKREGIMRRNLYGGYGPRELKPIDAYKERLLIENPPPIPKENTNPNNVKL